MADTGKTETQLAQEAADARRRMAELEAQACGLQSRIRRLESLNASMKRLSGVFDLAALGKAVEEVVRQYTAFDRLGLAVLLDDGSMRYLITDEGTPPSRTVCAPGSAMDRAIASRRPVIRQDLLAEDRFFVNDATRASGIRSDTILPLVSRNQVVGALSLASYQTGAYGEDDLELLQPLADQIAVLVDNARLYQERNEAYRELRLIYDQISELVVLVQTRPGDHFRFAFANRAYLEAMGLPEKEAAGLRIEEILPKAIAESMIERCREAIRKGAPARYEEYLDLTTGRLAVETTLTPVLNEQDVCTHLLWVGRNITERKQAEREAVRLERLHAFEEMAQGVSHNFNNMMVGVLGYAQVIEMQSQDAQAVEHARKITQSAMRAKQLVHRLNLSVGRGGGQAPHRVGGLEVAVREAVAATRPRWKDEMESRGVVVKVRTRPDRVPAVRATQVELHEILIHLIFNALDAMPDGGEIDIGIRDAGAFVALTVKDSGIGMDAETQRRIFEPFFTTKQDVGSGLGLSMVDRTMTGWGGRIEVDSAPGRGTTFTLLLPVWQGEEKEAAAGDAGLRGRLLVVDDEDTVLEVLSLALRAYNVDTAADGEDAVRRFRPGQYDAVLIDLGIPGIPGDEVARRIKGIDSRVVTVLITGWDLVDEDPKLLPFDFYISKPFRMADIQNLVKEAIASRKG